MRKPAFTEGKFANKKKLLIKLLIVAIGAAAVFIGLKYTDSHVGNVTFTSLTEEKIPQDITTQIIPEYRDMERALACIIDDKVYVLATRGEKPTTGYDIAIDSMSMAENGKEKVLTVNVLFTDPKSGASLTQTTTYPYVLAETNLLDLPEKIEMKIKYAE